MGPNNKLQADIAKYIIRWTVEVRPDNGFQPLSDPKVVSQICKPHLTSNAGIWQGLAAPSGCNMMQKLVPAGLKT